MPFANPNISWIDDELAGLTLSPSMSWTEQVSAIEALSEANLPGRPINYLIELKGKTCLCMGPLEENLAEIFLQFIPARTAIALLRPADQPPSDCEAEFHVRLSSAGYLIGNFSCRETALTWLALHPTSCAERNLHCGPHCPDAYSSTCPAIASREPAISPRQDLGPSAITARSDRADRASS